MLNDVANNLRPIEAIQNVVPNWKPLEEEEVVQGFVQGAPDNNKVGIMPDPVIVNFEDEDGVDLDRAMQDATKTVERVTFEVEDLPFYFQQVEAKMAAAGVKKNYTKFQVLSNILPAKVISEVKPLLRLQATDFPNKDAYKQLKREIMRIFGPKKTAGMERALGRVLVGKPSQLARALVNDLCPVKQLACTCCAAHVHALWKKQLPSQVRAGIAHTTFTKETFNAVVELADDIFDDITPAPSVAAARKSVAAVNLDETQPAIPYAEPEVAATRRGGRGGRGRGRGGRGRGGNNAQQASSSSSSSTSSAAPPNRGTKHPDLPAGNQQWCSMHFKWGKNSHFCSAPSTCPWKDVYTPRPAK